MKVNRNPPATPKLKKGDTKIRIIIILFLRLGSNEDAITYYFCVLLLTPARATHP
jgi:hypothetical protein